MIVGACTLALEQHFVVHEGDLWLDDGLSYSYARDDDYIGPFQHWIE